MEISEETKARFNEIRAHESLNKFNFSMHEVSFMRQIGPDFRNKALRLFAYTDSYMDIRPDSYLKILEQLLILVENGVFEEFLKLPNDHQSVIIQNKIFFKRTNLKTYLEILELAGSPKPVILDSGKIDLPRFFQELHKVMPIKNFYSYSIPTGLQGLVSDEIYNLALDLRRVDFDYHGSFTKTILLSRIYGEEIVSEIAEAAELAKVSIKADNLFQLLKNWDNVKNEPIAWALELVS